MESYGTLQAAVQQKYGSDGGQLVARLLHRGEERFISWLSRYARLLAPDEQPQLGDVALFQYGRCFSHGSILVDVDQVVHAYVNRGVILSRFNEDPLHGRPVQFWTLWGK